jgi:O-antigen ligase
MGNTYNYLTTVIRDLKEGFKTSPSLFLITLVLLTIPLNYAVNSIALGVYFGMTLLGIRKNTFKIDNNLLLPIMLFVLMAVSLIWTHDMSSSLKALSKSLPLLVVPICFFITSPLNKEEKEILIKNFSYGMLFFSLYYFLKAVIRFILTEKKSVFFYHELVTEDLNAIHFSVYISVALFYFITRTHKSILDKISAVFLSLFLILLSSKNITIVFLVLSLIYYLKTNKFITRNKLVQIAIFLLFLTAISFFGFFLHK